MLQKSTLLFLRDLKKNNQKDWFENNRSRYENAKADFIAFTESVLKKLSKTDDTIAHLEPRDCLFRINRDVRFSKNKAPYKTNMAMYISRGGKKGFYPGYYFHLEPGASFVAGGIWMPPAPELKKIRQEIDYNFEEFRKIAEAKKFLSVFGGLEKSAETQLSRPPKGYEADNPAIEYLRLKSLVAVAKMDDDQVMSKEAAKLVTDRFILLQPMIHFFSEALTE